MIVSFDSIKGTFIKKKKRITINAKLKLHLMVKQQPFGGARGSGTNDKAGSPLNLLRWVSPRTIKETFVTPTDYRYEWLG